MSDIAGYYNSSQDYRENPKQNFQIHSNMIQTMSQSKKIPYRSKIMQDCCFLSVKPTRYIHKENTYHVIFNGEIYNENEVRNNMVRYGYDFETNDTAETLAAAFCFYGPDFVQHINGVFAIAIYDQNQRSLHLYRDRFAVKPLYYSKTKDTFVFASRIDTLFEYPRIRPCIDMNGFNEIFSLGPAKTYGKGVFTGINELMPGECITLTPEYTRKRFYYRLQTTPHTDSYEDTIEKTKFLLTDSIRLQTKSDEPLCAFLSGGIDSSYVSAVSLNYLPKDQTLTTYSFDYTDNDIHFQANSFQPSQDRPFVDIMKKHLGSHHIYLTCPYEALADLLETSVDTRCLPTMADVDSSLLFFCREVSKHHHIALTGECADEVFGGYPWFHRPELLAVDTFPWTADLSLRKSLLHPEFAASLQMEKYVSKAYYNTLSEVDVLPEESKDEQQRRKIGYLTIRWFMQTLLDRMNRAGEHYGLTGRVPFADYRLVDYVFNIPWSIKADKNTPKQLLRICAKDVLPDTIFNRPKSPFPKTYHPKYEQLLAHRLNEVIHDSSSPIRSYLNLPAVEAFIASPKEYGKPWFGQLMAGPQMMAYLLQVNYWMKKYLIS